jgi:hypothetical protein
VPARKIAPRKGMTASISSPADSVPKVSTTHTRRFGATKPPRLPTPLIRPIEEARAAPER